MFCNGVHIFIPSCEQEKCETLALVPNKLRPPRNIFGAAPPYGLQRSDIMPAVASLQLQNSHTLLQS